MKKNNFSLVYFFLLLISFGISFTACKKKSDPTPVVENELVTTVKLTFTPVSGGSAVSFSWNDISKLPSATQVQTITLKKNTSYNMQVELLDATKNPVKDMTEEIEEKDTEHQFFFTRTGTAFTSFVCNDADVNGKPIGLDNLVTTAGTANSNAGTLRVILRHELNKSGTNVSAGDITNAGGSTDIDTNPAFNIVIVD